MNLQIATQGRHSRAYFNRFGDLRHIKTLKLRPLNKVLMDKYDFGLQDANEMSDFLIQILQYVPEKRMTAAQCLNHLWIIGRFLYLNPPLDLKEMDDDDSGKKIDDEESD